MEPNIRITVLAENTVYKQGLMAEHGLSLLIEADGKRILFDTGQGMALEHNMKALDITPCSIDILVLSHCHYDHTSGVEWLLQNNSEIKIHMHPEALKPCFSKRGTLVRDIGIPNGCMNELTKRFESIIWTASPVGITPGVTVTGSIPRLAEDEITDRFYTDKDFSSINKIPDDQAMFIKTAKGVVVILGCTHSGLSNTLSYISSLTQENKIYALIGGMHLSHATQAQVESNAQRLKELELKVIAPGHCTGFDAMCLLKQTFENEYTSLSVGTVIKI